MIVKTKKGIARPGVELIGQTKDKYLVYNVHDGLTLTVDYEPATAEDVHIRYAMPKNKLDNRSSQG